MNSFSAVGMEEINFPRGGTRSKKRKVDDDIDGDDTPDFLKVRNL